MRGIASPAEVACVQAAAAECEATKHTFAEAHPPAAVLGMLLLSLIVGVIFAQEPGSAVSALLAHEPCWVRFAGQPWCDLLLRCRALKLDKSKSIQGLQIQRKTTLWSQVLSLVVTWLWFVVWECGCVVQTFTCSSYTAV